MCQSQDAAHVYTQSHTILVPPDYMTYCGKWLKCLFPVDVQVGHISKNNKKCLVYEPPQPKEEMMFDAAFAEQVPGAVNCCS